MPDTKEQDLALWRQWKMSRSEHDLQALITQMWPVIRREMSRWTNVVAPNLLDNEAKKIAIKAFESYDPNMGTALSTHLTNSLQKLSRTAYSQQSTVSVPEQKRLIYNNYMRSQRVLEDLHGRPPTHDEIADHMRMPPKRLMTIVNTVGKKEFMESGDGPAFVQYIDDPECVHLAYHDMTPLQKDIFKMRTGYEGSPIKSGRAIMTQLNLTQGQLSYQIGQIRDLLEKAQQLR